MMINRRLIAAVPESKRYIAANVLSQWCSLVGNIALILSIGSLLQALLQGRPSLRAVLFTAGIALCALLVRYLCAKRTERTRYLASRSVKQTLREQIYAKLLRLGPSYPQSVATSEVVQMSVEGVDQLETYFGAYLPQFFYSMLAPLTLFAVLAPISLKAALVLLVCVPMIPIAIAAVQTWAKKLLARYWGQYTTLGDTFLENLQGLTTLKIYRADGYKRQVMNREAEKFRKITMKVLTMQLNSITIMDLVAFGGAALGAILAVSELQAGRISFSGCFAILLLSADFFIPMRQLGSYFHVAMNGMAASEKIFDLLNLPEPVRGTQHVQGADVSLLCRGLRFAYAPEREILCGIDLACPAGSLTAVVGESGSGKSTLAAVLMGRNRGYAGEVLLGDRPLCDVGEAQLMRAITYIGHNSYLFKGTVRENLRMGDSAAPDERLWDVLEQAKLAQFLRGEQGLDTPLTERAENLSGGQRQRLALARALLHDSPVYIFDEATSNIDVESENEIVRQIYALARRKKTVLMISHRLANVVQADCIYVLQQGRVAEHGTHAQLLARGGAYAQLWETQQALEHVGRGERI